MAGFHNGCQGNATSFLGYCERSPTVTRNGKQYCWQHDPERIEQLRQKRQQQRRLESEKAAKLAEARYHRNDLLDKAGVSGISNETLELIVKHGGIQKMLADLSRYEKQQ